MRCEHRSFTKDEFKLMKPGETIISIVEGFVDDCPEKINYYWLSEKTVIMYVGCVDQQDTQTIHVLNDLLKAWPDSYKDFYKRIELDHVEDKVYKITIELN